MDSQPLGHLYDYALTSGTQHFETWPPNSIADCWTPGSLADSHESPNPSEVSDVARPDQNATKNALLKEIDLLSWLSSSQRSLLHHYVRETSRLTTCDQRGQIKTCQMLIPRAFQSPALLKSLLAVAAVHRKNLTASVEKRSKLDNTINDLVESSLQAFQFEMIQPDAKNRATLSAAALMLCEQALHGGEVEFTSWRAHMEGAKALITSATAPGGPWNSDDDLDLLDFLSRWYHAVESLAALSVNGPSNGMVDCTESRSSITPYDPGYDYLDEYCGYNTGLNMILRQIGTAAWHRSHDRTLSAEYWNGEADRLEYALRLLMKPNDVIAPVFYPGIAERLSALQIQEFVLCDAAYQHMAFIHIQCRIRRSPSSSMQVQNSVDRILECASLISPTSGLSPWLALTGPVFTAGCVATAEKEDSVTNILSCLHTTVRSQSMRRALTLLKSFRQKNNASSDINWDLFEDYKGIDFIPF